MLWQIPRPFEEVQFVNLKKTVCYFFLILRQNPVEYYRARVGYCLIL
jgi:hypothetical protein